MASQASAHMAHVALMSACDRHSVMQAAHIAMQASSMAIIAMRSIPIGRIIMRIVVMHTSEHIAERDAQTPMPAVPAMASEHIVQACIDIEQASMASCISIMSMSKPVGIDILIISVVVSITRTSPFPRTDDPPGRATRSRQPLPASR